MAGVGQLRPLAPHRHGEEVPPPAGATACGNGSDRTPHPAELFGDDWHAWQPPVEGGAAEAASPDVDDPSRDAPVAGGAGPR